MKRTLLGISLLSAFALTNIQASNKVSDEDSLHRVIAMANADSRIHKIVFEKNVQISLTSPVVYTGSQNLILLGNGAVIDGAGAGSFTLDDDLTAVTNDGTLIFNTAGNITINKLTIDHSATRGIVVNIPGDAQGDDIQVSLYKVEILNSALYGLHIDDNANEFDEGVEGSEIGIELNISYSSFVGNGTGAIDFDGVRVDERAEGDIHAVITHTHIDGNGGDGIELDEAGDGNVDATMRYVTLNDNGFFNESDLDDGFDIDEAGEGNIDVTLYKVEVKNNRDEGLDFDEEDDGNVGLKMRRVIAMDNGDEGIKVDEEGAGDIKAMMSNVKVMWGGDDGIQFTESGEGYIEARLNKVSAMDNKKYGVKMEQWFVEDEDEILESEGLLKIKELTLSGNGKGDELELHNVIVE